MRSLVRLGVIALILGGLAPTVAQGQQGSIRGLVTDARSGAPLSGAAVHFPGLGLGTLTNEAGRYTLTGIPAGDHELRAELIGRSTVRQTVRMTAGATLTVNFTLETSAIGLDEIVVTGTAGAQVARALGNTVGRIDAAEIQAKRPAVGFETMLRGSEPGLSIAKAGNVGVAGGSNIRIRGVGSMVLGSQPLLYIDGVRVDNNQAQAGPGSSDNAPVSRMNDLNPEEIASVEVIKGPAAATLYGTEASNGVINIVTKRGAAGSPRISVRMGQGLNTWPDPETVWNPTYYRCRGRKPVAQGGCTPGEIVEFNVLREDRIRNGNEWFRTGFPRNYGASVEGGIETLKFYSTVDWDSNEGIVKNDWSKRLNSRANLTWTPNEKFDVQFGIGLVRSTIRDMRQSMFIGIQWSCLSGGCEPGSGASGVDGAFRGYLAYLPEVFQDSVFSMEYNSRSMISTSIKNNPTSWLTHRLIIGGDYSNVESSDLALPVPLGSTATQGRKNMLLTGTEYTSVDYGATATLDLIPAINSSTSAGVQYYKKKIHTTSATGNRFAIQGLKTVSAGAELTAGEDLVENKSIGAYLQEQLSWRNRLFLTAAMRGDDNSAFGENFDFVLYPKLSASWVVSEEPFMRSASESWLNQLRFRSAWGRAGQQPDVLAPLRTYRPVSGINGAGVVTPNTIGNADLRPEVGEELETGFDASLWKDRLSVQFTYYNRERKDALMAVPVRASLGFPGVQYRNLGRITGSGIELGTKANLVSSSKAALDLSLSFSTNKNEIASMGGAAPLVLIGNYVATGWAQQLFAEGFPLGAMFMKRVVSADIQGTEAAAKAVNVMCEGGDVLPISSPTYPIARGNGTAVPCATAPNLYHGQPIPTREASAGTTLTLFNNLRLYAQVDYMGGHKMIDGTKSALLLIYRQAKAIIERTDPILLGYDSLGRDGFNQVGLMDASFARLRNVSVSYDVPTAMAQRLRADNMSVSVAATNLWLIWMATPSAYGLRTLEPEARFTRKVGSDPGGLNSFVQDEAPAIKRFMATVRMAF